MEFKKKKGLCGREGSSACVLQDQPFFFYPIFVGFSPEQEDVAVGAGKSPAPFLGSALGLLLDLIPFLFQVL